MEEMVPGTEEKVPWVKEMVLGTEEKVPLMKEKGSKGRGEGSLVCHSLDAGGKGRCEIHVWPNFEKFMSIHAHFPHLPYLFVSGIVCFYKVPRGFCNLR